MAKFLLSANPAEPRSNGMASVLFHLDGRPPVIADKRVEATSTADALSALEAYKAEAIATGKPLAITIKVKEGRAPNGFKAAMKSLPYHHFVNLA